MMKKMFTYVCVLSATGEASTSSQLKKTNRLKKHEEVSSVNATTHANTQEEAFSAQGNISC